MISKNNRNNAHNGIDHIFKDLFPAHGMAARQMQIDLSHQILDTMLDGKIALCDAGTGIGKTYACLAAGTVYDRCRAAGGLRFRPIILSTSSIALQNAVKNEYLPLLSAVLLEDKFINQPVEAVIRKGKSHYVCDERLQKRLRQANLKKKNKRAAKALLSLRKRLDMDGVDQLSGYDRERVCVPSVCDCKRGTCRYIRYLDGCDSHRYLFQISNHNLLLADAIHHGIGRRPILPDRAAVIIDEAHKLPEAARQMFGATLTSDEILSLIKDLRTERFALAAESLEENSRLLVTKLSEPWDEENTIELFFPLLDAAYDTLQKLQRSLDGVLSVVTWRKLRNMLSAVSLLCEGSPDIVLYITSDEKGGTMLCAATSDLASQLQNTIWNQRCGIILTSGTLAIGDDFSRFKETIGLMLDNRVSETVFLSPFDYRKNCLLYFPKHPPRQLDQNTAGYYENLANEIASLVSASHGHALVLFTSYAAMSAVAERLKNKHIRYTFFTMGRNSVHTMERFRAAPGSVLLATGAAWEGFDFPGDCVSMLIIPRLPFAFPDAMKEREREAYSTLREFIRMVVVPEMQIKLRQGFGRAIRTENDTCVVAILDERATPGSRYYSDVISALPDMKQTRSFREIKQFYRDVKPNRYFWEGRL